MGVKIVDSGVFGFNVLVCANICMVTYILLLTIYTYVSDDRFDSIWFCRQSTPTPEDLPGDDQNNNKGLLHIVTAIAFHLLVISKLGN